MCYSLREWDRQRLGAMDEASRTPGSQPHFSRPRVIGAVAAGLVALAAGAAVLWPSSTPAVSSDKAAQPSSTLVIEQKSSGIDDGVPSSTDVARSGATAGMRHCEHDL